MSKSFKMVMSQIMGNGLVDMYAKCGSMEEVWKVFNKMPLHDVASWNAMLGRFAMHGHGKEVLEQQLGHVMDSNKNCNNTHNSSNV
jgi:pentatricopeptide repeat protein